jgi:hypothetical protein
LLHEILGYSLLFLLYLSDYDSENCTLEIHFPQKKTKVNCQCVSEIERNHWVNVFVAASMKTHNIFHQLHALSMQELTKTQSLLMQQEGSIKILLAETERLSRENKSLMDTITEMKRNVPTPAPEMGPEPNNTTQIPSDTKSNGQNNVKEMDQIETPEKSVTIPKSNPTPVEKPKEDDSRRSKFAQSKENGGNNSNDGGYEFWEGDTKEEKKLLPHDPKHRGTLPPKPPRNVTFADDVPKTPPESPKRVNVTKRSALISRSKSETNLLPSPEKNISSKQGWLLKRGNKLKNW